MKTKVALSRPIRDSAGNRYWRTRWFHPSTRAGELRQDTTRDISVPTDNRLTRAALSVRALCKRENSKEA